MSELYFYTPQMTEAGPPCANAVIILPAPRRPEWAHEAPLFEMSGQTILPYDMPIMKILEDNSMKDVKELENGLFRSMLEGMGKVIG